MATLGQSGNNKVENLQELTAEQHCCTALRSRGTRVWCSRRGERMTFIIKKNRRKVATLIPGLEAIVIFGIRLLAISLIGQVVSCESSYSSIPRLKSYYENAIAPFEASSDASDACRRDTETFQKALRNLNVWAVKMYDATGKPQSGLLNGNTNHMGDYLECVEALNPSDKEKFESQYCLASLYVEQVNDNSSIHSERLRDVLDRVNSYGAITSKYEEGPSFFPSFTPIPWGVCVPSSCSESDVHRSLARRISRVNSFAGDLIFRVKIENGACEVKQSFNPRPGSIIALFPVFAIVLCAIAGTIYDMKRTDKVLPRTLFLRLLLSFSLRRNAKVLFLTEPNPNEDDITCVHGIRAIFSLYIYILHRSIFGLFVAYTNRTYIAEILQGEWTMLLRSFYNVVDTFVLLSGLLTSYFAVAKLQNGKRLNIPNMYWQRYLKFTPIFIALVLIVGHFMEHLHSGPQYMRVNYHFINNCKDFSSIIKSLFYISNFDGINKMCYPPAHQLITDMQMYLTAPFFVLALWKWPKKAPMAFLAIIALLASYKYLVIYTLRTHTVIHYGVTLTQMKTSADAIYLNPIHRLTPYLFGICLGYFLRTAAKEMKLSKMHLIMGWSVFTYAAYFSFFGSKGAHKKDYVFDESEVPLFGSLQSLIWCSVLCWVIYTCHIGRADLLNRALSWKGFAFFSRFAYSVYMVQIVIMFFGIGRQMAPIHFNIFSLIDLNEIATIGFCSAMLNLLFLMPLIDIWNIMKDYKTKAPSTNSSANEINEGGIRYGKANGNTNGIATTSSPGPRKAENTEDHSSKNT